MLTMFYFLMTVISAYQAQAYRHRLFAESHDLCNELTCKGGVRHTACGNYTTNARCVEFEMIHVTQHIMYMMIMGHNGIRNKIAGDWAIANMHLLHWSKELARLSQHYIFQCLAQEDVCDFLVQKNVTIGHNYFFSMAPPSQRWAGRAIRSWYFELGYEIKNFPQFKEARKKSPQFNEFTQLIWPTTEFLGCAAAEMFNGYLASCHYSPRATQGFRNFVIGGTCSKCPEERPTCSRDFTHLCGIDKDISGGCATISVLRMMITYCILFIIFNTIPFY